MADFNSVLLEFLDSLVAVFPEVPALAAYRRLAGPLLAASPNLGRERFMRVVGPHVAKLVARDPTFFDSCPSIIDKVDMRAMWRQPDLTDESRDIIWQYLNTLYFHALGAGLPPDIMTQAQALAGQLQQKMAAGDLDASQLLGMLQQP